MTAEKRVEITGQESIVGILNDKGGSDKRLVLIVHGAPGHKNYYFLPMLAQRLPYSSFRFDFRGSGESGGEPKYNSMEDNAHDIYTVATYFKEQGFIVFAIIGHSRGAIAALRYAATFHEPAPILSHVVNIAARYNMRDINRLKDTTKKELQEKGYFEWSMDKNGQLFNVKVTQADVEAYTSWDNSHVSKIPRATCVLTCHGLDDTVVPPENAARIANLVPNHTLELIPGANHTFDNKYDELISIIMNHLEKHESSAYERAQKFGHHMHICIPRWVDVEGVKNFRDIGGWPLKNGSGYVRERTVFRSAHLGGITEKGKQTLRHLGITGVFDFRSNIELKDSSMVMPEIPGITYYRCPMFKDEDFAPEKKHQNLLNYFRGPQGIFEGYRDMLAKAKDQYRKIFLHILEHPDNAIVVHCRMGKDRTGLFFALLLGVCGVDDDIIANEFAMTTMGAWESKKNLEYWAEYLGITFEQAQEGSSASLPGIILTLDYVNTKYGSLEGYIRQECSLTVEQCEKLRDILVIPIRFEERQLYQGIEP